MNICERIDFILRGGVWELLAKELEKENVPAIITEVKGDDLVVIDAVLAQPENLIFNGAARVLAPQFPPVSSFHKVYFDSFDIRADYPLAAWKHMIRFTGTGWTICVFVREKPSPELLENLRPFLNVISHWNSLKSATLVDERLSALSYMVLATKNTLASVFEPMDLEYFASFIKDVLGESLFPKKVAVYHDDGKKITFLKGAKLGNIVREGIFKNKLLSPAPAICNPATFSALGLDAELLKGFHVVILPILAVSLENSRLFCVLAWDVPCTQETLNFMELFGNVASKALEINELNRKSESQNKQIESRSFTVAAFHTAIENLMSHSGRSDLLSFIIGIFNELSQSDRGKLVVYDYHEKRYILVGESFSTIVAQCFDPVTPPMDRVVGRKDDLSEADLAGYGFKPIGIPGCQIFPLWTENELEGFVAMSEAQCQTEIPDYPVVFQTLARIAAKELHYRFS